jgi:hypothetical protein
MKKIIAGALASVALVGVAQAATILTSSQTVNFGGTTDFTQANTFQLFDSTQGTLQSITITDAYGYTSNLTVTNGASSSSNGSANTKSSLTLSSTTSGVSSVISTLLGGSHVLKPIGDEVDYNLNAGATMTGASNASNVSYSANDTTASDLAYFTMSGGGTANITGTTFTQTLLANTGGNTTASQQTSGSGTFTIVYNYVAAASTVPEPATWAMMLMGFGFVGYGMRRRNAVAIFN